MKLVKQSLRSEMLDIYECPKCHKEEYYGMFHWHDGSQYCRSCIYNIWQIEEYQHKKYQEELEATRENREPCYDNIKTWIPSDKDYIFPIYSDGVNYSEKEEDYR